MLLCVFRDKLCKPFPANPFFPHSIHMTAHHFGQEHISIFLWQTTVPLQKARLALALSIVGRDRRGRSAPLEWSRWHHLPGHGGKAGSELPQGLIQPQPPGHRFLRLPHRLLYGNEMRSWISFEKGSDSFGNTGCLSSIIKFYCFWPKATAQFKEKE